MNNSDGENMIVDPYLLRVCLSCWKRFPRICAQTAYSHRRVGESMRLVYPGSCVSHWTREIHKQGSELQHSEKPKQEKFDVEKNPFYDKYQEKLQHMRQTKPQEFQSKVEDIMEKKKPKILPEPATSEKSQPEKTDIRGPKTWPPKSLDDIMKVELLKDLDAKQIETIWKERHVARDCVFAVIQGPEYDEVMKKSSACPTFIFPLSKNDGYEFYLCQFSGKDVYFTPLSMYQVLKENAPPCLTIAHFPELKDDKGIVLMAGEYDDKILKKSECLNLVKQMALFYGRNAGAQYMLVRVFNHSPQDFKHTDLIEVYKLNKRFLEEMPYQ